MLDAVVRFLHSTGIAQFDWRNFIMIIVSCVLLYLAIGRKFEPLLLIPIAMKKHAGIEPSMLQDLKKGKPCEIDAINGVVCEWGRKLNVKTPINDKIVEIVKQAQDGKIKLGRENIALFDDLL